jgi:branched-chain amino acid transport system substrate-binding protein
MLRNASASAQVVYNQDHSDQQAITKGVEMATKNRRAFVLSLVMFLSGPVACHNAGSRDIRIGALLPLSGSGANYGKSLQQGLDLALEEINGSGGINGKPLKIIYEDSQGDAKTGISGFNKLVSFNGVPIVIASISSVVLAVAPIADQQHIVLVNSSAMSPRICDEATNYLFSFMVSGSDEAQFMARTFAKKHGNEPIAILYSNNSSGVDTKDRFVSDLNASGGRLAIAEAYDLGTSDFRTQLTKIKASRARFGYLLAFSSAEFAQILRQSQELGLSIQWYSYSGFETKDTLSLAGSSADGTIYSYPSYLGNDALMTGFQTRFQFKYKSLPDIYTATSYDALKALAKAIGQNSDLSPSTIRVGLKSSDYAGLFGTTEFGLHQCVTRQLMWKTVKAGAFKTALDQNGGQ